MNLRGYSDDDYDEEYSATPAKSRNSFAPYKVAVFLVASVLGVTYAADINLGNSTTEFGQGILQTVACSGSTALEIKPTVEFANSSNSGIYKLSGITVSNIPSTCSGSDFTINAYDSSSATSLPLFNSDSTTIVIGDRSNSFGVAYGSSGLSVTTLSSSSFSVAFSSAVALASNTYRLAIQSGPGLISLNWVGSLGDTGPGGGKVFYYSAGGFNCGPAFNSTGSPDSGLCHYLEAAPTTWKGGASDPTLNWADAGYLSTNVGVTGASNTGVGGGYKNSLAILAQGNGANTAAGASRTYAGGGLSDWYLPSINELENLISYATTSPFSTSSPGLGMKLTGGTSGFYATSNQYSQTNYYHYFYAQMVSQSSNGGAYPKNSPYNTRPIRAF
jgi:hypothetical protein